MADIIRVSGLVELQRALRTIDKTLGPELRKALNQGAEVVAAEAARRVPTMSGKARSSVKAGGSERAAAIKVGGTKAPYYAWLEWGGRVGRNKSVVRPFMRQGRYLYPAVRAKEAVMIDKVEDALVALVKKAGL